jgi:hypothetical protein
MERAMPHRVARIDDTVNRANLHERAEAVAIPDFNYLEQFIARLSDAIMSLGRRRPTE